MELWEKNREKWPPMEPAYGKEYFLWMVEEIGESIAVLKKKGGNAVMEDAEVRAAFVEELSDVLMYYIPSLCKQACTEYGAGFSGGISQPVSHRSCWRFSRRCDLKWGAA